MGFVELGHRGLRPAGFEMLPQALPAAVVVVLQLGRVERVARGPPHVAALEHERHRVADHVGEVGLGVEAVQDGRTAMQRLASRDFDVIFCDLRMPDPDGPAILRWLRSARPRQAERLVFVTGDRLGVEADSLLASTGRPVIEKPFQPALVRKTARAVLAAAQGGPRGDTPPAVV